MGYSIYSDAKAAKAKKSRIGNILMKMSRRAYAEMFGPTVGDRVRLADTELFIQVEQDLTTYGEEVKFGGGKVIRDGMGQSQLLSDEVADTVITNALIVDWWGIVKADVGLKNGRIWKIGKAGNPDIQPASGAVMHGPTRSAEIMPIMPALTRLPPCCMACARSRR